MQQEYKVTSAKFDKEQEQTLIILLNMIIPPSEDGKLPGAADVGFFDYMHSEGLYSWIQEGLIRIGEESHSIYGDEFSVLPTRKQTQLINKLRRGLFRFFFNLTNAVMQCYYQDDHVLKAIGIEARPPFPDGYNVEEGDFALLEPVYLRGIMYRQ